MSIVVRNFLASPVRLSSRTWEAISALICQSDSVARSEFDKISGLASCIINDEIFAENPLVVKNKGPRLRVYCLYGEDATSGEDKNEDVLTWKPTEKEWHAYIPCASEEVEETTKSLKAKSKKFSIYDVKVGVPDDETASSAESIKSKPGTVDWEGFENL